MSDYQEAVQHPAFCFRDPLLGRGTPALDSLGLPRPVTGNFACVYRIITGRASHAARCFLRYRPDHEQRYAAIARALDRLGADFTVGFEFQRQGIRVAGRWYPLVRMEWADGETLGAYIERRLHDRAALNGVAEQLSAVVARMQSAAIAHGDLQLGNILVCGSRLRLIDYDGMFVPELSGLPAAELGHPNFQHPARSQAHFGPGLDEFALLVIRVSLLGLCREPGLWSLLRAGDDRLLFGRDDLLRPGATRVWQLLTRIDDDQLQTELARLRALTSGPPDCRPQPPGPRWRPVAGPPPALRAAPETAVTTSMPEWLWGQLPAPAPVEIRHSFWAERLLLALLVLATGGAAYWVQAGGLAPAAALRLLGLGAGAWSLEVLVRYLTLPVVRAKLQLRSQLPVTRWELVRRQRTLRSLEVRWQRWEAERRRRSEELDGEETRLLQAEAAAVGRVHRRLAERLAGLAARRRALRGPTGPGWLAVLLGTGVRAALDGSLSREEAREVERAAAEQAAIVKEYARRRAGVEARRRGLEARHQELGLEAAVAAATRRVGAARAGLEQLESELVRYTRVSLRSFLRGLFFWLGPSRP